MQKGFPTTFNIEKLHTSIVIKSYYFVWDYTLLHPQYVFWTFVAGSVYMCVFKRGGTDQNYHDEGEGDKGFCAVLS